MIALPDGFRPALSLSPVTTALTGALGAGSFRSSTNTGVLLAGTATGLYAYLTGAWSSVLGSLSATTWRFAQFGNLAIGVNGASPVAYNLNAGTAATLAGSPPVSDLVATVREFVFLAGDPSYLNNLTISGYNDPTNWSGGLNQQLSNAFPNGGAIMGLAGGETGLILLEHSIRRATYVAGTTVWQFDEISKEIGCMAKGSVVQSGQLVFFLSDHGFMVCDRNTTAPIGQEVVDRTFFATYSRQEIRDNIRAAVDPQTTEIMWSMPGNPGAIWRYNYLIKRWSPPTYVNLSFVFSGFSQGYTLEQLDALYPGGLETIPISLDATKWTGGFPSLYVTDNTGIVSTVTNTTLPAWFSMTPAEIEPGKRIRIRFARVVGDIVDGTVTVDARARAGDPYSNTLSGPIRPDGKVPLRANGRHIGIRVDVPSGVSWSYILGVDLEYEIEGDR
jgi:hypothetical protein